MTKAQEQELFNRMKADGDDEAAETLKSWSEDWSAHGSEAPPETVVADLFDRLFKAGF